LETIATAYRGDFEMQGGILRQAASLYQRFGSLLAAEDLSQHLLVGLIVFAEVSAYTALAVMDCDHIGSLRFRV
jgi:hypothetical protein